MIGGIEHTLVKWLIRWSLERQSQVLPRSLPALTSSLSASRLDELPVATPHCRVALWDDVVCCRNDEPGRSRECGIKARICVCTLDFSVDTQQTQRSRSFIIFFFFLKFQFFAHKLRHKNTAKLWWWFVFLDYILKNQRLSSLKWEKFIRCFIHQGPQAERDITKGIDDITSRLVTTAVNCLVFIVGVYYLCISN